MRLILTLLMALALAMLPVSGASRAEAGEPAMACHQQAPDDDAGVNCAKHCMTLIAAAQPAPSVRPSIANTLRAPRALAQDARAPRGGAAPETPPPRR